MTSVPMQLGHVRAQSLGASATSLSTRTAARVYGARECRDRETLSNLSNSYRDNRENHVTRAVAHGGSDIAADTNGKMSGFTDLESARDQDHRGAAGLVHTNGSGSAPHPSERPMRTADSRP